MRTRHGAGGGVMLWVLADLLLIGGLVLLSDKSGLTKQVAAVRAEIAAAKGERDQLAAAVRDRDEQYRAAVAARDALIQLANEARAEMTAVRARLDQRDREYATLVAERDTLNKRYADLKVESDNRAKQAAEEMGKLNEILATMQKEKVTLQADLKARTERVKVLADKVVELNKQVEGLLAQIKDKDKVIADQDNAIAVLQDKVRRAQGVAHQLLSLKSRSSNDGRPVLNRVAILIDTSKSMDDPLSKDVGSRWGLTQQLITTWVTHLGARQAFVIQFADKAKLHATKGQQVAFDLTDPAERKELVGIINDWKPDGATATHDALFLAYTEHAKAPLDAIILFTDGAPTVPGKDPKENPEEAVFRLCREQKLPVPVNVIGVGVYVNTDMRAGPNAKESAAEGAKFLTFMIKLAGTTGGSFQAR